ncbi:cupin [Streptomyces sp. CB02923]|uniref:cupin domain-containing protein n=1 Tax=Streptomyces sp. CB02923 TaxID=1718985 RepID=UPI00093D8168|nr:cupin domain-containing protein [Streptomyces sp. CB02923]OKH99653.1 cupin [Streptomyces sp. CB02923]
MSVIDVRGVAAALPEAWSSRSLGRVSAACLKVLRMDELPGEEEAHEGGEALFVLDGRLELSVDGAAVSVGQGEMYMVPAGASHAVRAGSRGTLMIVEGVGEDGGSPGAPTRP